MEYGSLPTAPSRAPGPAGPCVGPDSDRFRLDILASLTYTSAGNNNPNLFEVNDGVPKTATDPKSLRSNRTIVSQFFYRDHVGSIDRTGDRHHKGSNRSGVARR